MTIAKVNTNTGGKSEVGPDRARKPSMPNSVTWISGNTESEEINVEGFVGVGFFGLDTGQLVGATAIQVHVSNKLGGVFAKLNIDDFVLTGSTLAFSTTFVAEWCAMKFVLVGALTGSGEMPYCLS